jgi:hypothetical protein
MLLGEQAKGLAPNVASRLKGAICERHFLLNGRDAAEINDRRRWFVRPHSCAGHARTFFLILSYYF